MAINNKQKKNKQNEATKEIKIARSTDYKLFYTDRVEFRVSPFDFKLTFLTTQDLLSGETLVVEHSTLVLSPQHAKELCQVMINNVAAYEKEFGEISMSWRENPKINNQTDTE